MMYLILLKYFQWVYIPIYVRTPVKSELRCKLELGQHKVFEKDSINLLTNTLESIIARYLTVRDKSKTNQIVWRNNLVTKTLISLLEILIYIFFNSLTHLFPMHPFFTTWRELFNNYVTLKLPFFWPTHPHHHVSLRMITRPLLLLLHAWHWYLSFIIYFSLKKNEDTRPPMTHPPMFLSN